MKRLFKRRRNRCLLCLATVLGVVGYLVWDVVHFEALGGGIPGPAYLVLWLGVVLLGLSAAAVLCFDLARAAVALRRPKAPLPGSGSASVRRELVEHEAPVAHLVPRA